MANVPIERHVDQELSQPQHLTLALQQSVSSDKAQSDSARSSGRAQECMRRLAGQGTRSTRHRINKPSALLGGGRKKISVMLSIWSHFAV